MKKLIMFLALFVFVGSVSACKTTIQDDKVTIEDKDTHPHDGDFCPPGHAKKGWC